MNFDDEESSLTPLVFPHQPTITDYDLDLEFQQMEKDDFFKNEDLTEFEDENYNDIYCRWQDCYLKFKRLDDLVQHITSEHVSSKKSNSSAEYVCKWENCPRRGSLQHSRFALISHIRTHTGEKPFYCIVPECLKAFTRSDALLKHLKTVHDVDSNNLVDAYEILNGELSSKSVEFRGESSFKASDAVDADKVMEKLKERMEKENEGEMGYGDLIDQYCESARRGEIDGFLQGPVADLFDLRTVKFNPAMKDNVYKDTRLALSNYNLKRKGLEEKDGGANIVSVGEIEDSEIDKWDEKSLVRHSAIMEEYCAKLEKLKKILDDELVYSSEVGRYWWVKKELLSGLLSEPPSEAK
ncbi:DEKNAAC105474 [Brettanomyces naardenensis]|uniref:DEKNAAC105474 n=1 Tax=Brettanomyces naardenensis TaxID=13370 RepID=A0A448YTH2_BRENA|nr:DEKNAAC105474 [Brettanomyces naardenensis]